MHLKNFQKSVLKTALGTLTSPDTNYTSLVKFYNLQIIIWH